MNWHTFKHWIQPNQEETTRVAETLNHPLARLGWAITTWPRRHFFKLIGSALGLFGLIALLATGSLDVLLGMR